MEHESSVLEGLESEARVGPPPPRFDRRELACIFAGGFLGAILRGALARSLHHSPSGWPWAIFSVNLAGAALLAHVITRDEQRPVVSVYRLAFVAVGFCGALTTFSTLIVELLAMVEASRWSLALGYGAASVGGGLAAVWLARGLARRGGARP